MGSFVQRAVELVALACIGLSGCGGDIDNEKTAQERAALTNGNANEDALGSEDVSPGTASNRGWFERHLHPIVNCVALGAYGKLEAHFGYHNPQDTTIDIQIGPRNAFVPAPFGRGQPTKFTPGESDNVVSVTFDERRGPLVWELDRSPAIAWKNSPPCVPSFAGAASATVLSDSEVTLAWPAATDYVTPSSDIVYDICSSTTSGDCAANFVVAQTTAPGAAFAIVSGLTASTAHFFVVRARNAIGNEDTNTVEVAAQTCATGDRACNGACTSLASDPANCGACGNQCLSGDSCSAGQCVNPPPLVTDIAAGSEHTCVHVVGSRGSQVRCWGSNAYGQLGNGTTTDSPVPVEVPGVTTTVAIVVAGSQHTCIKGLDGLVGCWGDNSHGQLGNGTTIGSSTVGAMFLIPGSSSAGSLAAGGYHTCEVLRDGTVMCWGANAGGQLGNGTDRNDSLSPVAVSGLTGASSIAAGIEHTCVALSNATVQCWGWTRGFPPNFIGSSTPRTVLFLQGPIIAAGWYHTCSSDNRGGLYCWGWNEYGQLGKGDNSSWLPVLAEGGSLTTALAAGAIHSCVNAHRTVTQCWGNNSYGQLGDGTNTDSSIAVVVQGMGEAIKLAAGGGHTCALLQGGTVYCWGKNDHGQLGNGTTANTSTPTAVKW